MQYYQHVFLLFTICIVLVNAVSDEMKDLLASLHAQCAAKTGVSEDTITKAQKGEFEEDDKLKCYMKCLLEEPGLFDENDKIDLDGLIAMLPDEIRDPFSPTIKKCGAIATGNPCEASFLFYKCCFDEAPNYYLLA